MQKSNFKFQNVGQPFRFAFFFNLLLILSLSLILSSGCRKEKPGAPLGSIFAQLQKPEVWKVPIMSQAQLIGLKRGDVIASYDEEIITTIADLYRAESLAKGKVGNISITILRDGKELSVEAKPEPLGVAPIAWAYSGSLAKSLEDIMNHFAQPGYYDWLSALTGEAFSCTIREGDWSSWGVDSKSDTYFEAIARLTGLSFTLLWCADSSISSPIPVIIEALNNKRVLLVRGGWSYPHQHHWGIITRYEPADSTVYGYTIENGEEQSLSGQILSVYEVKCQKKVSPDPTDFLITVLDQALEIGLASSDTGWHSGLEAYDILVKDLSRFPVTSEGTELATQIFYRLIWRLIAQKESAIRFFEDIKNAFPEKSALFDEVVGRQRAILGRLEGCAATHLPLNSKENQEKLIRVLIEIQELENDLLGIYEEIIGEM